MRGNGNRFTVVARPACRFCSRPVPNHNDTNLKPLKYCSKACARESKRIRKLKNKFKKGNKS